MNTICKAMVMPLLTIIMCATAVEAQNIIDVYVYHGAGNSTILWDKNKQQFLSDMPILKHKGQSVNIRIVNPNPIFYTYELKQNEVEVKDDFPDISLLLGAASKLLSGAISNLAGDAPPAYITMLTQLEEDIEKARKIIRDSDIPESLEDAMAGGKTGGLKRAIILLKELPGATGQFNSPTLGDDLNKAMGNLDAFNAAGEFEKKAYTALNAHYVQQVNEIKTLVNPKNIQEVITNTFTITEKTSKIVLVIKAKDSKNDKLQRDIKEITIATLQSFYERATVELVPVANVRFANNVSDYYLDNGLVKQRIKDDVSIMPGVILNVNVLKFGEIKEMAVGVGLGYNISTKQNQFNQFSLSSLFSYRNFLRVGLGVGYSSYPSGLKDGGKVDAPLPKEINNLNDIIEFNSKAAFFISFSFTGLKLK